MKPPNFIYVNACNFVISDGSKLVVSSQIVPKYVLECVSDDKSSINLEPTWESGTEILKKSNEN